MQRDIANIQKNANWHNKGDKDWLSITLKSKNGLLDILLDTDVETGYALRDDETPLIY